MAMNAALEEQSPIDQIQSINEAMEELASADDWERVSDLLKQRDALLRTLDPQQQRHTFEAARVSTQKILDSAKRAHDDVREKLAQLQRGKEATDSYRAYA